MNSKNVNNLEIIKNKDLNNKKTISYQDIILYENLIKGLAKTKCNVAVGLGREVTDNITEKKLNSLLKELKSQKFKPSPVKIINIAKPNGKI